MALERAVNIEYSYRINSFLSANKSLVMDFTACIATTDEYDIIYAPILHGLSHLTDSVTS